MLKTEGQLNVQTQGCHGHIPPSLLKRMRSFKYNFAIHWSKEQEQQVGMLNRGGDQGHVSLVLL